MPGAETTDSQSPATAACSPHSGQDVHCARAWLALAHTKPFGLAAAQRLLERFGGACAVLAQPLELLAGVVGGARAQALKTGSTERERHIERALSWARTPGQHLITRADPRFPRALALIPDPPLVLFVRGDPMSLSRPTLAIVGSRHASRDGLSLARELAAQLAACGTVIVSGLATGIDSAAHQGALCAGGLTVAFVGTGADLIYPRRNQSLAQEVMVRGAVVSELPLGSPPVHHHFPQRNRLIAGLSAATVVIQAARHSGSLITARLAAEFGREVMAIPGSVHSPLSKGCHQLIREGAALVEDAAEIKPLLSAALERMGFDPPPGLSVATGSDSPPSTEFRPLSLLSADAVCVLKALSWSPADPDLLAKSAQLSSAQTAAALVELELSGLAERMVDGRFQRLASQARPSHIP